MTKAELPGSEKAQAPASTQANTDALPSVNNAGAASAFKDEQKAPASMSPPQEPSPKSGPSNFEHQAGEWTSSSQEEAETLEDNSASIQKALESVSSTVLQTLRSQYRVQFVRVKAWTKASGLHSS